MVKSINGKPPSPSAPKILKKRKAGSPTTPSLKRVTFEVEKLVATEGDDEERAAVAERIAVGLGAKKRKVGFVAVSYRIPSSFLGNA